MVKKCLLMKIMSVKPLWYHVSSSVFDAQLQFQCEDSRHDHFLVDYCKVCQFMCSWTFIEHAYLASNCLCLDSWTNLAFWFPVHPIKYRAILNKRDSLVLIHLLNTCIAKYHTYIDAEIIKVHYQAK